MEIETTEETKATVSPTPYSRVEDAVTGRDVQRDSAVSYENAQRVGAALAKHMEETRAERDRLGLGRYRLVLLRLTGSRQLNADMAVQASLVQSGRRLAGGGDEGCWLCRRLDNCAWSGPIPAAVRAGQSRRVFPRTWTPTGCGGIITGENVSGGVAVCPGCGMRSNTAQLTLEVVYRDRPARLATRIVDDFLPLAPGDMDIKFITETRSSIEAKRRAGGAYDPTYEGRAGHQLLTAGRIRGMDTPVENLVAKVLLSM